MSETTGAVEQYNKDVQKQELPDGSGGKYTVPPDTAPSSATNPALMGKTRLLGTKEMRHLNDENRATYLLATDNGQSIYMDETGNIFIGSAKVGEDEQNGQIIVRSQGDLVVKVGGRLLLEIENLLDEEKPLSFKVGGKVNIESTGSDVNIHGKNLTVSADTDLTLKGEKVMIQAGKGAGNCEITCGEFAMDNTLANISSSGPWKHKLESNYEMVMKHPKGIVSFDSMGAFSVKSLDSTKLEVGGRLGIDVGGVAKLPVVPGPESFKLTAKTGDAKMEFTAGKMDLTVGKNFTEIIGGNNTQTITGNHIFTQSGATAKETFSGDLMTTVTKDWTQMITANTIIDSKGTLNVMGTGATQLSSQSTLNLTSTGAMTLFSSGIININA
tara:strand:+ start:4906 stop:6060 length:1155 start_codon:yes stop_codon:yes gene_type:complete